MLINNYSFPHPVLGRNDDVQGLFETILTYTIERKIISLSYKIRLKNKTLEELVNIKKAACYLHLTCRETKYRNAFKLDKPSGILTVQAKDLRGRVVVYFFILADKTITGYVPDGENSDYEGYSFEINEGDILAHDFRHYDFLAEKTWEKLLAVSSYMKITKSEKPEGPAEYDLNGDKIIIYLSQKDYNNYYPLSGDDLLSSVFHASIVLPALMFTLNSIIDNESEYSEKKWFTYLRGKIDNDLKEIALENQNVPKISQLILNNPIGREFPDLNEFIKKYTVEGE